MTTNRQQAKPFYFSAYGPRDNPPPDPLKALNLTEDQRREIVEALRLPKLNEGE